MKITLTPTQERFIDSIPELESLARKYVALDRLLTKLKTEPELTERLILLRKDIERFTDTLYRDILLGIIDLKPEKAVPIFTLNNPELEATNFNMFMYCYKVAKMKLPLDVIEKIQYKIFIHIQDLVEVIQKHRHNYNLPKNTKLILEALQKIEGEAIKSR